MPDALPALAGMIAEGETVIDTAEAAAVTYPGFAEDFRKEGRRLMLLKNDLPR